MLREISHSEVASALDCQAKHAFAYTGALTGGDALDPKSTAPMLRDGRAWGAAMASHHLGSAGTLALIQELGDEAERIRGEFGMFNEEEFEQARALLVSIFYDYIRLADPLPLVDAEREIVVPIPSRRAVRSSNRYRLRCYLDGVHRDLEGREWIVEFKLRTRLSSDEQIALSRQTRWYAWAWWRATGREPAGVIVDERLKDAPKPVRVNKDGTPSKQQSCTPEAYEAGCRIRGVEPDEDVLQKLRSKEWQKRTTLFFRGHEMEEAGWQLTSAANLIHQLDTGLLYPVRNPSPQRCSHCQFRHVCPTPEDGVLIDSLYLRKPPKGSRPTLEEAA